MDITGNIQNALAAQLEGQIDSTELKKDAAADKFESLLATMLVKELRKGLPNGFFGGESGSDIFEGWFDEHIGKALARDGGIDLEGLIRAGIETKISSREGAES